MIEPVTTDGSLKQTRVLVAHRSAAARRAAREVLGPLGCVVTEADSVDATLASARTEGADVLLLEGELGGAMAEVKRDPDLFRIALVLVGDLPDVPAALHALERGAHDVLPEDAS